MQPNIQEKKIYQPPKCEQNVNGSGFNWQINRNYNNTQMNCGPSYGAPQYYNDTPAYNEPAYRTENPYQQNHNGPTSNNGRSQPNRLQRLKTTFDVRIF